MSGGIGERSELLNSLKNGRYLEFECTKLLRAGANAFRSKLLFWGMLCSQIGIVVTNSAHVTFLCGKRTKTFERKLFVNEVLLKANL